MVPTTEIFEVTDKIALVTGSTRGLGKTLAHGLIQAGAQVIIHGTDPARATEVAKELGAAGAVGFRVDEPAAVAAGVDKLIAQWGVPIMPVSSAATPLASSPIPIGRTSLGSISLGFSTSPVP